MSRANQFILAAGILMFLAVTGFSIYRARPKTYASPRAKLQTDIQALGTALQEYEKISGALPTQEQGLAALVAKPTASPVPPIWYQMMRTLPTDPWGESYMYQIPPRRSRQPYDLFSKGPDKAESKDDIGNWSGE